MGAQMLKYESTTFAIGDNVVTISAQGHICVLGRRSAAFASHPSILQLEEGKGRLHFPNIYIYIYIYMLDDHRPTITYHDSWSCRARL
jgi:hypothetical protein